MKDSKDLSFLDFYNDFKDKYINLYSSLCDNSLNIDELYISVLYRIYTFCLLFYNINDLRELKISQIHSYHSGFVGVIFNLGFLEDRYKNLREVLYRNYFYIRNKAVEVSFIMDGSMKVVVSFDIFNSLSTSIDRVNIENTQIKDSVIDQNMAGFKKFLKSNSVCFGCITILYTYTPDMIRSFQQIIRQIDNHITNPETNNIDLEN